MSVLSLDFETFSHTSLKAAGAWKHVQDPNFEVTCVAWAFDDHPVKSCVWPATKTLPKEIEDHLRAGGEVHAWNAQFEYVVLTGHYGWALDHSKFVCTMQRALAYGLPGALAEAGPALGLQIVKDASARRLMLQMSKPKKDGTRWHHTDPAKLKALEAYCVRDVAAEREVGRHIPVLTDFEKRISLIDAKSNERGMVLDDQAILTFVRARERQRRQMQGEVYSLTGGAVLRVESEVAKLQAWLKAQGVNLVSVDKAHIEEALQASGLPSNADRVLRLRQAASKSSLGKLDKMIEVQGSDGRARGLLQYYGAGRTGRWAGRLVQVQNLPRNLKQPVDPDQVMGIIRADPSGLDLFWPKPLEALAACLRGCITASPGKVLAMIDLSQIEARVLAWLAGQEDVLETFRRGEDIYAYAAAQQGSSDRQFGKVLVLACGYGMGPDKFMATAETYGVTLTREEAEKAVWAWREKNPAIKWFWWDLLTAAKRAMGVVPVKGSHRVTGPIGGRQKVGKWVELEYTGRTFKIYKPNGGILYYHKPSIRNDEFVFWGAEQKTGAWMELRSYGGKFAENITQAVARDVMCEALDRIHKALRLVPIMTVHDELVYEVDEPENGETLQRMVNRVPRWATGLPIASKLSTGFRYGK